MLLDRFRVPVLGITSHTQKRLPSDGKKVGLRVSRMLQTLMLARNQQSTFTNDEGMQIRCAGDLPDMDVFTQDLAIFDMLLSCRNTSSTVIDINGNEVSCARAGHDQAKLPGMTIFTQDLKYTPHEQHVYDEGEARLGQRFDFNFATGTPEDDREKLKSRPGQRFQQIFTFTTHLGFISFKDTTSEEWKKWRKEGFPTLV